MTRTIPTTLTRLCLGLAGALLAGALDPAALAAQSCARTVTADVVALDQPIFYNRLGAYDPAAMIFALRGDVVPISGGSLGAGNARLRDGKRPRPLVLRMNEGDCLKVKFQNLLSPTPADNQQPATRHASVHVIGMQLVGGIASDGSHVGKNASSLVAPGGSAEYTLYGQKEGTFLLYSTGATTGGEGDGGSIARGLFGAVNVEPKYAQWFRSQITAEDLLLATRKHPTTGEPMRTPSLEAGVAGHPIVDYSAVYPTGHPLAGRPILRLTQEADQTGNVTLVHGDLNAVITGPNMGYWSKGSMPYVSVNKDREGPFREFTVIFHDEIGIVQAFDEFEDPVLEYTLTGGRDGFAINYGAGGAGAMVLANRFGVGPAAKCNECKLEEFFLSSWAGGDPAMVVDVPANTKDASGNLILGAKATKALYADDPSNVHHSYLNDRIKFRNLHAGPKEHHIFHLHAHQWLKSPDADNSTYLDSQGIGPGGGYTYEIAHGGSGNRNMTPGDAIFHCHFYPHFAQGMWELWRTHDVFEAGTVLDADGKPAAGARALPDAEIAAGTPIPAVVPIPGKALPPMPGTAGNPGYPFFIAGEAGHRAPKPPLATAFDGGLPRHVVVGGEARAPELNPLDFSKENVRLAVKALPEGGTELERQAMRFHAMPDHETWSVDPYSGAFSATTFKTNGMAPVAGAPFADPCMPYEPVTGPITKRTYKGAAFQMDAKYNKAGWHHPQHRMYALWEDVVPTIDGKRPPEPLFMRTSTNECIEYRLVNLMPGNYEMDDFQVKTPTDIVGQHIHLVKFDVIASDGSANGFNYEIGSMAPDEVRERIHAVRKENACVGTDSGDPRDNTIQCPVAKAHPFFGAGKDGKWVGAQETIERWYTDNLMNASGEDRTLRTVFTHDHYGPSTHQQTGLYAGLVGEPRGSRWRHQETGAIMGTRHDGGPTSWRADILTANVDSSYREFNLMLQDFTLAYQAGATTFPNPRLAINPDGKAEAGPHKLLQSPFDEGRCPNGTAPPCPGIISVDDPGTMTVNYRNEPIALRVRDPKTNTQAAGDAGDLSKAFASNVTRADPALNTQPTFYPALSQGYLPGDPFTPLIRAFENDRVQVRVMVGGQEEGHNFSVHGLKWLGEPSWPNSGYRSSQFMGISEHFEFVLPPLPGNTKSSHADYLYQAGSSTDDSWNGIWGILRAYRANQTDLLKLPNNTAGKVNYSNGSAFSGVCPTSAAIRKLDVTAVTAAALPGGTLTYNARGKLHDPNAIVYVRTADLDARTGKLKADVPVEPLILRAVAGECIDFTLRNKLPATLPNPDGFSTLPMIVDNFNANDVRPSSRVGLSPQLLAVDVTRGDGADVGTNPVQTVAPGGTATYRWYAGHLSPEKDGTLKATPVEFGAVNLISSDPIKHASRGAVGTLIIEPIGATWTEDATARASATVTRPAQGAIPAETFREFVLVVQNNINMRRGDGSAVPNTAEAEDSEDSGQKGFNYRTEPMWLRMGYQPNDPLTYTRTLDFHDVLSNSKVTGNVDPETPVFTVTAGMPVRLRVLHPGGNQRNNTFALHGHGWQENPFTDGGTRIGDNRNSEWKGSTDLIGPTSAVNLVLTNGAGGLFRTTGDFLFRDMASFTMDGGLWGIMRVVPATSATTTPTSGKP